ncbi:MAG: hypothetical protein M5U26_25680 [Planctomycetota bacterium]|nr:hypothetical protein [Planctomycetota bacterium]
MSQSDTALPSVRKELLKGSTTTKGKMSRLELPDEKSVEELLKPILIGVITIGAAILAYVLTAP